MLNSHCQIQERHAHPYRWMIFTAMLLGEIMDVLDASILNVAGDSIREDFALSASHFEWAVSSYALSMGMFLIISGRLGDIYGRKLTLACGLAVFGLASAGCAAATSAEVLIIMRFIQGIAGALILPQGLSLLKECFNEQDLAKALAIFAPVLGAMSIAGPVLGGWIIDKDVFGLGWRAAVALNIPLTIVSLMIVVFCVDNRDVNAEKKNLDITGAMLMIVSCGMLVYPFLYGGIQNIGLSDAVIFAMSAFCFYLFYLHQKKMVLIGKVVLVEPGLFANHKIMIGMICMALFFSFFLGSQLAFTLLLQMSYGYDAALAGLSSLPLTVGTFLGAASSGAFLLKLIGGRILQLGSAIQILGFLLIGYEIQYQPECVDRITLMMFISGLGAGLVISSLISIIITEAKKEEIGSCSGLLSATQSISAVVGIAICTGLIMPDHAHSSSLLNYKNIVIIEGVAMTVFFMLATIFLSRYKITKKI